MLDIHPPHHAATTWRDFFIHIATITIGLFIAIGLEQTVEAIHHLHQRHQLEEHLREELRGNLRRDEDDFRKFAQILTPRMRNLVSLLWSEWMDLEQQIVAMNEEVEQIASSDPACQRLRQIPGIGPLVATAIVAAIGNGAAFHKGREFSSWLGLVPRQHSTGGRARLFGISKRGNCYLRKLLVHGARSAVLRVKRERSPFGPWLDSLERRSPVKVVITAAANKLARIAWAVLSSGQDYRAVPDAMTTSLPGPPNNSLSDLPDLRRVAPHINAGVPIWHARRRPVALVRAYEATPSRI